MTTNHDPTQLARKIEDLEKTLAVHVAAIRDTKMLLRASQRAMEIAQQKLVDRGNDFLAAAAWRLRDSMRDATLGDIVKEAMKNATGKDREAILIAASMRPASERETLEDELKNNSSTEVAHSAPTSQEDADDDRNSANDLSLKPAPITRPFAPKGG